MDCLPLSTQISPEAHPESHDCYSKVQRDFTDVNRLKILRWENYPGLHKWAHCNHNGLYIRDTKRSSSQTEGDVTTEAERHKMRFADATVSALKSEEEGHEPKTVGGLSKLGRVRKWKSLLEPQDHIVLLTHYRLPEQICVGLSH